MDYKQIYTPRPRELMRVFGMFSGGASSLKAMVNDTNRDILYSLVGSFTNNPEASGIEHMGTADVPVEVSDYSDFHRNGGSRKQYFDQVSEIIKPYGPDIIVLSGFMLIIPTQFLREYWNRILNVHPARLELLTGPRVDRLNVGNLSSNGVTGLMEDNHLERKFVGNNPVYDAVMAGEEYTKSTIHAVRPGTDTGPIVVQSREFMVDIPPDMSVEEYSSRLQDQMKWNGDGPAYLKALEFLALGRLGMGEDDITVFLDGRPLPYMGYQLTE